MTVTIVEYYVFKQGYLCTRVVSSERDIKTEQRIKLLDRPLVSREL